MNPYVAKTIREVEAQAIQRIRVVKQSQSGIIPDRRAVALKRISDMKAELGRMVKLLDEMRADLLHLTIE